MLLFRFQLRLIETSEIYLLVANLLTNSKFIEDFCPLKIFPPFTIQWVGYSRKKISAEIDFALSESLSQNSLLDFEFISSCISCK